MKKVISSLLAMLFLFVGCIALTACDTRTGDVIEIEIDGGGDTGNFNTTKADNCYTDIRFTDEDVLVFGRESCGLPEDLLKKHPGDCIRIPMIDEARSLNLSNAVAIVTMEALRQTGFKGLKQKDHRLF